MTKKLAVSLKELNEITAMKHELQESFARFTQKMKNLPENDAYYFKLAALRQQHAKSIIDCIKMENFLGISDEEEMENDLVTLIESVKKSKSEKKGMILLKQYIEDQVEKRTLLATKKILQ